VCLGAFCIKRHLQPNGDDDDTNEDEDEVEDVDDDGSEAGAGAEAGDICDDSYCQRPWKVMATARCRQQAACSRQSWQLQVAARYVATTKLIAATYTANGAHNQTPWVALNVFELAETHTHTHSHAHM